MALIAVVLGIALGGGAAFLLEFVDRRIRSTDDLAEMLQLPVLGVIVRPKAQRRLAFRRRSTALVAR
jgi:capsular polysaccharide biosynthesis protein